MISSLLSPWFLIFLVRPLSFVFFKFILLHCVDWWFNLVIWFVSLSFSLLQPQKTTTTLGWFSVLYKKKTILLLEKKKKSRVSNLKGWWNGIHFKKEWVSKTFRLKIWSNISFDPFSLKSILFDPRLYFIYIAVLKFKRREWKLLDYNEWERKLVLITF
jgi:hypothetical protein